MHRTSTWITATLMLGTTLTMGVATAQVSGCEGFRHDCFNDPLLVGTGRPATFTVDNTGATLEPREPMVCFVAAASVWVKFTAQTDGIARVRETGNAPFAVSLAAFRDGGSITSLTHVACDGVSAGARAEVEFTCQAGRSYYLQIASAEFNATGPLSFKLEGCGQTGPSVSTGSDIIVRDHESTSATPCQTVSTCRALVSVDVWWRVSVDRTPTTPSPQGGMVTLYADGYARAGGQTVSLGGPGFVAPPPPPPPGCGGGCEPGDYIVYVQQVRAWATGISKDVTQVSRAVG